MTTLQGQIEKIAHDVVSGPDLSDSIEVAVVGGILGAIVGYAKDRNSSGAKSLALWAAGLGVAGQYMLFHMLKPATRRRLYPTRVGEEPGPSLSGPQSCRPGTYWDDYYGKCLPSHVPLSPSPQPFPDTLDDWRKQQKTSTGWGHVEMPSPSSFGTPPFGLNYGGGAGADMNEFYVGAVNRGGYGGSGGMPYGPGPWPTQHRPDPQPFG